MFSGIELRGLSKTYPDGTTALDGIDLHCPQGRITALVGPSGSGKSTVLKIVAGLLEASGGLVLVAGHDVTALAPDRRNIGLVFQSYSLFPNMSVQENVEFGLRVRGVGAAERRRRALRMLETVHMADLAHRRIHQLSGGQQQRVALARAVVFQPHVLLLDEPLSALDPQIRQELREELVRLLRQLGFTAIYVTHDQQEATLLGDQVVVINHGRIEQAGDPVDIHTRPTNEFVARFIGRANILDADIGEDGAGRVIIRVAGGTIPMAAAEFNARWHGIPKHRARLMVRPHDISLTSDKAAHMHLRIREIEYLGDHHQVRGESQSGEVVDFHIAPGGTRPARDELCPVRLDPGRIHFFAGR